MILSIDMFLFPPNQIQIQIQNHSPFTAIVTAVIHAHGALQCIVRTG